MKEVPIPQMLIEYLLCWRYGDKVVQKPDAVTPFITEEVLLSIGCCRVYIRWGLAWEDSLRKLYLSWSLKANQEDWEERFQERGHYVPRLWSVWEYDTFISVVPILKAENGMQWRQKGRKRNVSLTTLVKDFGFYAKKNRKSEWC